MTADEELDEPQETRTRPTMARRSRTAAKRRYFPSSLGLSTLVAAGADGHQRDGPMGRLHRRRAGEPSEDGESDEREPEPPAARLAASSAGADDRGAARAAALGSRA